MGRLSGSITGSPRGRLTDNDRASPRGRLADNDRDRLGGSLSGSLLGVNCGSMLTMFALCGTVSDGHGRHWVDNVRGMLCNLHYILVVRLAQCLL
jgi:hypothetical protein